MAERLNYRIFLCDLCRSIRVAVQLAAPAAGPEFNVPVLGAGCFISLGLFQIMYMRWLIIDIYIELDTNYFPRLRVR